MIDRLAISNFKKFDDAVFELGRLTVLTGVNGGGKSTVVQALNLLHQCALADQRIAPLSGLPGLDLGQASDVLCASASADEIVIGIDAPELRQWRFGVGDNPDASCLAVLECPSEPPHPIGRRGNDFTYLAAERMGPRIAHPMSPWTDGGVALGADGRYVGHALAEPDKIVSEARRHPDATSILLQAQVEAWMSELVGRLRIDAGLVPRTGLATVHVHAGGFESEWMLLTNTGFGISYSLPIVVAALSVPEGGLLIIDSPEAHLHPSAQSALGQFLTIAAAGGVQILIETHSDHILNGIRRAIANGTSVGDGVPPLSHTAVVVHYFGRDRDPERLAIGPTGAMSAWPDGFFDQMEIDLGFINRKRRR
ncbi:AAA family ATPase [Nocardia arizonensis]|uniref:AAA family ATPase n=1 Tax=Nocardia arizonensis TaxID=1141647 RepID=UPI0006D0AAEE|nr:DUF3696 domain-containing protein [Nocardia arizonensis]